MFQVREKRQKLVAFNATLNAQMLLTMAAVHLEVIKDFSSPLYDGPTKILDFQIWNFFQRFQVANLAITLQIVERNLVH